MKTLFDIDLDLVLLIFSLPGPLMLDKVEDSGNGVLGLVGILLVVGT